MHHRLTLRSIPDRLYFDAVIPLDNLFALKLSYPVGIRKPIAIGFLVSLLMMVFDVVPLISKGSQVIRAVVVIVFIFVVDYMLRPQIEMFRDYMPCQALSVSILDIPRDTGIEKRGITFMIAKMVKLLAYSLPGTLYRLPASGA